MRGAVLLLGLLTVAAAPRPEPLPLPPIPPAAHPAYNAAPVPNDDAHGPAEAQQDTVRFAPSLFRREKNFVPGQGYMPGSSFKEERERFDKPTPGFNLRMTVP